MNLSYMEIFLIKLDMFFSKYNFYTNSGVFSIISMMTILYIINFSMDVNTTPVHAFIIGILFSLEITLMQLTFTLFVIYPTVTNDNFFIKLFKENYIEFIHIFKVVIFATFILTVVFFVSIWIIVFLLKFFTWVDFFFFARAKPAPQKKT